LEAVIRECLAGKAGAWKMIVDLYSKRIFNMAYQFAGSYQEAEDLTQDIFFKLYGSLKKYSFEKNFTAWLITLAKNHLIDEYRRTKWEKTQRDSYDEHFLASPEGAGPEHSLLEEETRKVLWESLNRLPSEIRMAVILKEIQGKKYEEVAEIMDIPLGTVKSRINRGRLHLAKILKGTREKQDDLR
jgi:RNA polymerase sigma-70 factor (ECF subfamily)